MLRRARRQRVSVPPSVRSAYSSTSSASRPPSRSDLVHMNVTATGDGSEQHGLRAWRRATADEIGGLADHECSGDERTAQKKSEPCPASTDNRRRRVTTRANASLMNVPQRDSTKQQLADAAGPRKSTYSATLRSTRRTVSAWLEPASCARSVRVRIFSRAPLTRRYRMRSASALDTPSGTQRPPRLLKRVKCWLPSAFNWCRSKGGAVSNRRNTGAGSLRATTPMDLGAIGQAGVLRGHAIDVPRNRERSRQRRLWKLLTLLTILGGWLYWRLLSGNPIRLAPAASHQHRHPDARADRRDHAHRGRADRAAHGRRPVTARALRGERDRRHASTTSSASVR